VFDARVEARMIGDGDAQIGERWIGDEMHAVRVRERCVLRVSPE
jgi:hypothetical protein